MPNGLLGVVWNEFRALTCRLHGPDIQRLSASKSRKAPPRDWMNPRLRPLLPQPGPMPGRRCRHRQDLIDRSQFPLDLYGGSFPRLLLQQNSVPECTIRSFSCLIGSMFSGSLDETHGLLGIVRLAVSHFLHEYAAVDVDGLHCIGRALNCYVRLNLRPIGSYPTLRECDRR